MYGKTVDQLPAEMEIHEALDPNDPEIDTSWEIMGIYKETGIVRAAENFMPKFGVALIVFGGLFSTMSALNASVLASSRVGFSMGRERMLPKILGTIHPLRRTDLGLATASFLKIETATAEGPMGTTIPAARSAMQYPGSACRCHLREQAIWSST